ncbi:MAG: ABC transporter ATP-binding protein [Saprospiraceae bacterium]|nr:ABC transporter ATP-binding protein [Saprospiraceae bacterium]
MAKSSYEQRGSVLEVENLSLSYDGKTIIKDISFTVLDTVKVGSTQGQTVAFVGRSGRGKSTLFRALSGLEQPSTGTVKICDMGKFNGDNAHIPLKPVHEGDVGFVDQKYTLFRHKTVTQALHFAMRKSNLSEQEKTDKINVHLEAWGLKNVRNQYPNELSGGQRQRTAILEQLLSSGNFIILDEPFSGLDVGNIESVKKAFNLINGSHELNTVLFSTHDIELAIELADSIYVVGHPRLSSGELAAHGTILKHFDLKEMGLAWSTEFNGEHQALAKEIKTAMLAS